MKLFGKELTGKASRDLITRLVLIVVSGAVLIVSAVTTVAWFSHNTTVRGTGMQVVVDADNYKLLIQRTTEYDREYTSGPNNGSAIYPGISDLKEDVLRDTEGYSLTATDTSGAGALAFELVNEDVISMNGVDTRFLSPGSYGTVTFYIQKLTPSDITVDFSLNIGGYADGFDESDNPIITRVDNETYLNFLKGHILFFTGRETNNNDTPLDASDDFYVYTGLIDEGTFSFDTTEKTPVTVNAISCYRVTLYWEWPLTYSDITSKVSSGEYPSPVGTYLSQKKSFVENEVTKSYFLAKNLSSSIPEELNDGYNDADQIIGDNIQYVVVFIE